MQVRNRLVLRTGFPGSQVRNGRAGEHREGRHAKRALGHGRNTLGPATRGDSERPGWRRHRRRTGSCSRLRICVIWSSGLRLGLLLFLPLRLRPVWLLRPAVVRRWLLHWRRALVRLGSARLWLRRLWIPRRLRLPRRLWISRRLRRSRTL